MAARRTRLPVEEERLQRGRRVEARSARAIEPARPVDAAHEHGPPEEHRSPPHGHAYDEHCPPEVYVG